MADPNAPASLDPFAAFDRPDPSAGALTTSAAPQAAPTKPDPFAAFDRNPTDQQEEGGASAFGSLTSHAALNVLPALASLPAMGVGAEAGAALGAPFAPFTFGLSPLVG